MIRKIGRRWLLFVAYIIMFVESSDIVWADCFPSQENQLVYVQSQTTDIDASQLESTLQQFYDEGLQMILVITDTLCGMDIAMYANRIGQNWGVGTEGLDDGVIIVMVPKRGSYRGQLFVAPGRGVQGVLPDAYVKRLTDATVREFFANGQYTEGLLSLVNQLAQKVKEERQLSERETMTLEEFVGEAEESSGQSFWGTALKILLWLFIVAYSTVVLMYVTGNAGIARFFQGANPARTIDAWKEAVLTAIGWSAVVGLITWNWMWGVIIFAVLGVAVMVGYFFLYTNTRLLVMLTKKVEWYLLPLALVIIGLWVFVKLIPYLDTSRRRRHHHDDHHHEESRHYDESPREEYSSSGGGRAIEFGGGQFNGGGAGSSW